MSERPAPYVGVSGVISVEQQRELTEIATPLFEHGRRLALGVKAVRTTQWLDRENRFGAQWYPVGDDISHALAVDNQLRVAQIYLDQNQAKESGEDNYEQRFVDKLLSRTGGMFNAVQFDMLPWDNQNYEGLFEHIKAERSDIAIILQAYKGQMENLSPNELLRRLSWYKDSIDYVLFDASHGTGSKLDVGALAKFVEPAYQNTSFGVGVAGGLDASTVESELPELLEYFPDLSFDAEGRLHKTPDGSLDMQATRDYLEAAERAVAAVQPMS